MGVFKGNVAKYSREITKQYASSQDYLGAGESHLLIQMQGIPLQNWDAKPEPKTQRMSRAGITEVGQSEGRKVKYFFNPLEQLVYHLKKEDPNQLQMFHLGWYETCDILTKNKSLSKIHLSFSNVADRCFIQAATTSHGTRLQIPGQSIDHVLNDKDRHELTHGTLIKAGEKNSEDMYLFIQRDNVYAYLKAELEKSMK